MKKYLLTLIAFFVLSLQAFAQVAPNFDIYAFPSRYNAPVKDYFNSNGFVASNLEVMTQGTITYASDKSRYNPESIKKWLDRNFPNVNSQATLMLDWEAGPYNDLKNYPITDSRFKKAEATFLGLLDLVQGYRPKMKVGIYMLPYRFINTWQSENYNAPSKLDRILSKSDVIFPSVYILYTDEERGRAYNLDYIKKNVDEAMYYGKKFNKPVLPVVWHRVHISNKLHRYDIMQKETFASYIKYIQGYSYQGVKPKGVVWWDGISGKLNNLKGINGHLKGTVYNAATYNAMLINYAKHVKKVLNYGQATPGQVNTDKVTSGQGATGQGASLVSQKVVSYTLINANTGKDIQTISDGAVLNLSDLPTTRLNIRANTSSSRVGSVKFSLSGKQNKTEVESVEPYELMGDNGRWTPIAGSYTLKATPYTGSGATGSAGSSFTVNFTVVNNSADVASEENTFTLVNAETNQDIQTLTSGATINLSALPTKKLNIRYNPGSGVRSVVFLLSGAQNRKQIESGKPYAMFTDTRGDYYAWTPATGNYTIKATPYSQGGGKGKAGKSLKIDFKVVDNTRSSIGVASAASKATAADVSLNASSSSAADVLTAYPVPASTVLYVEVHEEAGEGAATIEVQDLNGKVVLTKKVNSATHGYKTELDVSGIKEGLYVLAVSSSAGRVTKRVVIN